MRKLAKVLVISMMGALVALGCSEETVRKGCSAPSECPGTDSACEKRTCNQGVCGLEKTPKDTPTETQISKDCRKS
ncbi:MAG: hypothetical protein HY901_15890, partial [Deltaproteobacteria bacterium]|nr:hypothetical protein [Deltaproteobacteria bacterium]